MGGAVSAGVNNDHLVDNLKDADYIKSSLVEDVFRAVDRGDYYLSGHKADAYKDLAWKHGNIHVSAPCIYSEVMEALKLEPGLSFLNLGSGTGYLSTMVGLVIGANGINHGIEIHQDVIDFANERLQLFLERSPSIDQYDFCEPVFIKGNCLLLSSGCRCYDRVYCGAACPPEHENFMKNLLNVGGVLVMPLEDQLIHVTRTGQTSWITKNLKAVSFAPLILPSLAEGETFQAINPPEAQPRVLQDVCRIRIRHHLRGIVEKEYPRKPHSRVQHKPRPQASPPRLMHNCIMIRSVNNMLELAGDLMVDGDSDDDEDAMDEGGDAGPWARRPDGGAPPPQEDDENGTRRSRNRARFERFMTNAALFTRHLGSRREEDGEEEEWHDADDDGRGDDNGAMSMEARDAGASNKERMSQATDEPRDTDDSDDNTERNEGRDNGGAFRFNIKQAFRNSLPKERKRQHNRRSESEPSEKQPGKSTDGEEEEVAGVSESHPERKNGKHGNGLDKSKSRGPNGNTARQDKTKGQTAMEDKPKAGKSSDDTSLPMIDDTMATMDAPMATVDDTDMDATNEVADDDPVDDDEGLRSDASSSSGSSYEGSLQRYYREKAEEEAAMEKKDQQLEPSHLSIKIQQLPLPKALISFLLYHRKIAE